MSSVIEPMQRVSLDPGQLMADHPPELEDANKKIVFDIAHPPGSRLSGNLCYTRWDAMELPNNIDLQGVVGTTEIRSDYYDYQKVPGHESASEWHVNFADRHLFAAYGTFLFAQDEMQVAEHPVLGSLREYLSTRNLPSSTADDANPTPVLLSGVARCCQISTEADPNLDRPYGLYGNEFADASEKAVRLATQRIDPPTISNIIAIAAPEFGWGDYDRSQISYILVTAFTGFRAAVLEASHIHDGNTAVIVHTGYWGCGAFGGNRELMAMLQMLAAEIAGVTRLIFHAADESGIDTLHAAKSNLASNFANEVSTTKDLISKLVSMRFQWGVSNGT